MLNDILQATVSSLNDAVCRRRTMRRFVGYRPNPPEKYLQNGHANAPDEARYEGVVFTDGTVVIRWLTSHRSHSIWSDYESFWLVHGHPEYGNVIRWLSAEEHPEHDS